MAAVFPLDTTKPWVFNGVTYEYDSTEDRWSVVSTTATDQVVGSIDALERTIDVTNSVIDQEIENRSNLLDAATTKNNQQDASILELDQRLDAISDAAGTLQFKGRYTYVLEKSEEACTQAYLACLIAAAGDPVAAGECSNIDAACNAALDEPYSNGTFTSKGTTNVISDIEEFVITGIDLDGQSIDWLNVAEVGDYLEMFGIDDGDTALYEIIEEPKVFNVERSIRVKFIRETGAGDGKLNLQENYTVRVFKTSQGLDLTDADKRYVIAPYVVYFADSPADITPVADSGILRNGELWFDTTALQMFVWNNNSWVAVSPPPTQDIRVATMEADIQALRAKPDITSSTTAPASPKQGDLWFNPSTLKFAFYTAGAWINPDQS
jgi:hypothetical protein